MHDMKLVDFAFKAIKNKEKDIKVRLNDEKRSLIKKGDIIIFHHLDTDEIIKVKVINLYRFKTFKDLFNAFPNRRMGLSENDDYTIMNNFYSQEDQDKYGALGIEIELL